MQNILTRVVPSGVAVLSWWNWVLEVDRTSDQKNAGPASDSPVSGFPSVRGADLEIWRVAVHDFQRLTASGEIDDRR